MFLWSGRLWGARFGLQAPVIEHELEVIEVQDARPAEHEKNGANDDPERGRVYGVIAEKNDHASDADQSCDEIIHERPMPPSFTR